MDVPDGSGFSGWGKGWGSFGGCGEEPGDPWEFSDPRRDETAIPYTDSNTIALIDDALDSLVVFRCPLGRGDGGAAVSCLVSLIEEARSRLWDAVADAKDQGYTWDDIAERLSGTAGSARRRYGGYTSWRRGAHVERTDPGPCRITPAELGQCE
jgi:hypothetical protein